MKMCINNAFINDLFPSSKFNQTARSEAVDCNDDKKTEISVQTDLEAHLKRTASVLIQPEEDGSKVLYMKWVELASLSLHNDHACKINTWVDG